MSFVKLAFPHSLITSLLTIIILYLLWFLYFEPSIQINSGLFFVFLTAILVSLILSISYIYLIKNTKDLKLSILSSWMLFTIMTLSILYSIDIVIYFLFDEFSISLKLKLDDARLMAGKKADSKILPILIQGIYVTLLVLPLISLIVGGTYAFLKKIVQYAVINKKQP